MQAFFDGVGAADNAGIWEDKPVDHGDFRQRYRMRMDKQKQTQGVEEGM
jgi:hypothetical protein